MTAEIAVLNRNGIALAADSAVTVSGGSGIKTFDTVNKVFTLSKLHPVAIMVFGNAEFMRFPWETIVKMYRQQKGAKNEDTIVDWAADFCSWLKGFGKIRDADINDNIELILSSWFENLQRDALRLARSKKVTIPSQDYVKLLLSEISKLTNRLAERPDVITDTAQKAVVEEFGETITKAVSDIFQVYESEDVLKNARELGLLLLFKNIYSDHSSGIVIAGFGEKGNFPVFNALRQ